MNGSFWSLPLRTTRPLRIWRRSPGPATTRLMKFTSAFLRVGFRQTCPSGGGAPHMSSCSAPVGGWKTTTSPTSGSEKRAPMRLTSTRWPISSVGTIDSLGILYGLMRRAWLRSGRPSATATMRTSSSSEPEADEALGTSGRGVVGALGGGRPGGVRPRGLVQRPAGDPPAPHLVERLRVARLARHLGVRRRGGLGRGIVQEPRLHDLLRLPGVAALAHAGALADATAQVVELGPPHVAAGGDLDALDLGRVQRERALHADAEGLLAHGEGLADALALALDDDALEDLGAAARALDDLEVDLEAVARLEAGDAAQLRALEGVDDGAHGQKTSTGADPPRKRRPMVADPLGPRARGGGSARAASGGSARGGRTAGRPAPSSRASPPGACSGGTQDRPPGRRRKTPPRPSPRARARRGACAGPRRSPPSPRARRRRARSARSRAPGCRSDRSHAGRSLRSGRTRA